MNQKIVTNTQRGQLKRLKNEERELGPDPDYWHVIGADDGEDVHALLTWADYQMGAGRGTRNQEDLAGKIGKIVHVTNNGRRWGEALDYVHLAARTPYDTRVNLLFTEKEWDVLIKRAAGVKALLPVVQKPWWRFWE